MADRGSRDLRHAHGDDRHASIVNVALPHLRGTLSASVEEITWVSTGYVVASVIIMPLTAWLGARFGRKRIYMSGLALFLVGSFFCGAARSLPTLVVFRILQGIGAGSLQPTEQAILRETFPPKEQGMAMGLYGFAIMLGPAIGPTLGTDTSSTTTRGLGSSTSTSPSASSA